jgi:large subunit ribosomal protein L17
MRHGVKLNRLGRKTAHRKALMMNLACQLIEHKRIITTTAKAKALRVYVEPLLTRSKTDDTHNRRMVFSYLQSKETIIELFSTVSEKIGNRPGGYTRIIKMQPRIGDAAEMAMIELVDFNTVYNGSPVVEEKKKTRRSRGAGKATETGAKAAVVAEETPIVVEEATVVVEETPVAEVAEETPVVVEEATVAVEETPVAIEEVTVPANVSADDLKIVEGIGPKIAELFIAKGITTFAQLATTDVDAMKAILEEGGPAFAGKDPGTWAAQAQMAADGKMDELMAWQEELKGGK